jgi:hypothetical protein
MKRPILLVAALALLSLNTAMAQQNDTTFLADAKKNAIRYYTQSIGVSSHLFNGSEYKEYKQQRDEHPYLYDDIMFGSVKYGEEVYDNVPLYYDLERDQLVTSYAQGAKVQLLRSKVEYFDIDTHRFVHLDNDKVAEGYYDLLYNGNMKFYVKRQKVLTIKMNGNDADNIFEQRIKYYILKNGVYHSIKSKGSVLGLMKDKKKELKRVLKEEKLKFGKNREKAVTRLLQSYEQTQ